jgi:hypothetical protein
MRRIDELHLNFPFAGARVLRDMLKLEGIDVGRKHVRTLMGRIGIAAIYRKRNTSAPHPAHPIYPYLLKNSIIDRPNQEWGIRYHVHPDETRLRVPGGDHRLGHPPRPRAPGIDQFDSGFLRRGTAGGGRHVRHAGDLQH